MKLCWPKSASPREGAAMIDVLAVHSFGAA
jgi:hypothetical protein